MGNYKDLEYEFIERTLKLINQYNARLNEYEFNEQYNHTLLINCLLGLIVLPKEKVESWTPKNRLTKTFAKEIGLVQSVINPDFSTFREFITGFRNGIAHFDIKVESLDARSLIDEIVFFDSEKQEGYEVVRFRANELLPFVQYFAGVLLKNMKHSRQSNGKPVPAKRQSGRP